MKHTRKTKLIGYKALQVIMDQSNMHVSNALRAIIADKCETAFGLKVMGKEERIAFMNRHGREAARRLALKPTQGR